jgi:hypothetical protein
MTETGSQPDQLDNHYVDHLAAIGRSVASVVPFAGGLLAEVVGTVIPGQRADRIAAYLRELNTRVELLADQVKAGLASNAEKIGLIEEGGFQAARATSSNRISQIVEAVARGIAEEDAEIVRRKRLLLILGELDDDEIGLLNAYGRSYGGMDRLAFESVSRPMPVHMQAPPSLFEQNELYEAGVSHLSRLQLLSKNYGHVKRGEMPPFDPQTGDFKHTVEISLLGRMLLTEIGLQTPFDASRGG